MICDKCGGLVVVNHDEVRCLICGKQYYAPEQIGDFCTQGGVCGRKTWKDGLCDPHYRQRMAMVNRGRHGGFKYRG